MKMNRTLSLIALTLGLGSPFVAFADVLNLQADLTAASEVPPKASDGRGQLTGTYDTSSKELSWHVVYADLTGPATMAHFHGPAPVGKNAGVMIPIDAKDLPSPIDGHATLTDAQAKDLLAGNWYFNVHTAKNPGGEIRGQVGTAK
ncbi:CHRD domain-containing protein [Paraburkholderia xenovorans]|uniref:CHRD domain-containing protein n=1 Tax=Paraburkholderia xenovorans TaxID=36873 RepID=UPI0038BAE0D5